MIDQKNVIKGFKRVQLYLSVPNIYGYECGKCREKVGKCEQKQHLLDCKKIIEFYKYNEGDRILKGRIKEDEIDGRWYLVEKSK